MITEDEIIEQNLPLVHYTLRRYFPSLSRIEGLGYDYDDIVQECSIALLQASRVFDESRNTQLATFVIHCIKNTVLTLLRDQNCGKRSGKIVLSLDSPLNLGQDTGRTGRTVAETLGSDDSIFKKIEDQGGLKVILAPLTESQKKVFEYYLDHPEATQEKVALALGREQSVISRNFQRGAERIRRALRLQDLQ